MPAIVDEGMPEEDEEFEVGAVAEGIEEEEADEGAEIEIEVEVVEVVDFVVINVEGVVSEDDNSDEEKDSVAVIVVTVEKHGCDVENIEGEETGMLGVKLKDFVGVGIGDVLILVEVETVVVFPFPKELESGTELGITVGKEEGTPDITILEKLADTSVPMLETFVVESKELERQTVCIKIESVEGVGIKVDDVLVGLNGNVTGDGGVTAGSPETGSSIEDVAVGPDRDPDPDPERLLVTEGGN
ncbi:hypothetical protein M501DRAFT_991237 [Patellaria atrata CBS 101060]|uniref:Uncharacterized protein n=1 Tax=Patellaria atrata CBS 101060 TaxID=1346257 RepID=A0A9P4SCS6_9PEZI|nr:hypothetical protein M501DRAFT_991237 [Patellaria atrata CBS 101060]